MGRRRMLIVLSLFLATAVFPWGDGQARAQSDENDRSAAMERLRERAERVQQKRQARITQADRQAAADRAAARGKAAAGKKTPEKVNAEAGKGGDK